MQTFTFTHPNDRAPMLIDGESPLDALEYLQKVRRDYREFDLTDVGAYTGYGTVGQLMDDMRKLVG